MRKRRIKNLFVTVAELQVGPAFVCSSLRPARGKGKTSSNSKAYAFSIMKADQIFDILIRDMKLKFPEGHKIPYVEEIKNKKYCKYHHKFGDSTNSCVHFREEEMAIPQIPVWRIQPLQLNRSLVLWKRKKV